MKIPYGKNLPTKQKKELLSKLGFNVNRMPKIGQIYYLEVPNFTEIRCEEQIQSFFQSRHRIFCNNLQVIFIHTRRVFNDTYVYFNISASAITEALSNNPSGSLSKEEKNNPHWYENLYSCICTLI